MSSQSAEHKLVLRMFPGWLKGMYGNWKKKHVLKTNETLTESLAVLGNFLSMPTGSKCVWDTG